MASGVEHAMDLPKGTVASGEGEPPLPMTPVQQAILRRVGVSGFNQPKRTPQHPTKSHVVVAKVGPTVKTIRFGQQGVSLPRVAEDQARVGTYVPQSQLQPGDGVFFADSSGYIHHMGLYIGGGKMLHAPRTGDVVKVSDITTGYFASQYAGARRYSP